jgi:flap endonuclease-1
MGIRDLFKLIEDKVPKAMKKTKLSKFSGWRMAVDCSIFIYRFAKGSHSEDWLAQFGQLAGVLYKNDIIPIFIFDGKPPEAKDEEKEERFSKFKKVEQRIDEARQLIKKSVGDYQYSELEIERIKDLLTIREPCLLDLKNIEQISYLLNGRIEKWTIQTKPITKDMGDSLFGFMKATGFATVRAPTEAEAFCSYLCKTGIVDCVISNDSDVLAYGSKYLIRELNIHYGTCQFVELDKVLEGLQLDQNSFLDLCIMLGCDYNSRSKLIDGTALGMVKSLKLIQTFKIIEKIPNLVTDSLKFEECRKIFESKFEISKRSEFLRTETDWKFIKKTLEISKYRVHEVGIIEWLENILKESELIFV